MKASHSSVQFHDHFSSVAHRYADFRPHYPAALFDYLASLVPRTATVWDCAAGNGQASLDLAERFDHVIATDASADQIASARTHPKIEYRVAPAEQSGLADESIGLITVAQAVHWFDFDRFFAEARRALIPGGALAVWAYGVNEVEEKAINDVMQDFYANNDVRGVCIAPNFFQAFGKRFNRIGASSFNEAVGRRPGAEVAEQLIERPSRFHAERRRNDFSKRKWNGAVAFLDELAFGRPVGADDVWPLSVRVGRK
jgi:ubiquinone/menaquinone biosynthesis C-methylase UbiE